MPIYEFECRECGFRFEMLLAMRDASKTQECPSCGKKMGERRLSATSLSLGSGPSGSTGSFGGCGSSGFG